MMTYGVFLGKWGHSPPSEASDTVLLVQRISFPNTDRGGISLILPSCLLVMI